MRNWLIVWALRSAFTERDPVARTQIRLLLVLGVTALVIGIPALVRLVLFVGALIRGSNG